MRAGPAFLQFDWSKAGLGMDLQSSYVPIRRLASNFFQDREDIGQLFMWLQTFYFKPRKEPYRALVLSRLKSVKVY